MFWLVVAAIVIVSAVALVLAARLQRKRLQHRFRLEISNVGNVRSRYYLRTEGAQDLSFRFVLDGDPLPEGVQMEEVVEAAPGGLAQQPVPSGPPSTAASTPGAKSQVQAASKQVGQAVDRTLAKGGAIADGLTAIGSMLPVALGGPLLRQAARLQRGRMNVRQVQGTQRRVQQVKSLVPGRKIKAASKSLVPASPSAPASTSTATAAPGDARGQAPATASAVTQVATVLKGWFETPYVRPKEMLAVDLMVRATSHARGRQFSFQILSRSADQQDAPQVAEDGNVHIGGGFWSQGILPYAVIVALSLALVAAAGWLSSSGYLAW